jgi:hypothetical protein
MTTREDLTTPLVITDSWGRTRRFKTSVLERLQRRIKITDNGCHEFQGFLNNKGYGQIGTPGRKLMYTHRVMWIAHNGEIPPGMVICHKCDNPACCNIDHLFLGTMRDNSQDMSRKGRANRAMGTANPRARFNQDEVDAILAAAATGETKTSIAKRFGTQRGTIHRIIRDPWWASA